MTTEDPYKEDGFPPNRWLQQLFLEQWTYERSGIKDKNQKAVETALYHLLLKYRNETVDLFDLGTWESFVRTFDGKSLVIDVDIDEAIYELGKISILCKSMFDRYKKKHE